MRVAAAKEDPPPSKEDKANPNKADFSAYWSLKFREFFSKRRQYLELSRKRQEPPAIFQKIDEQIKVQEEKLEAARMQARWVGCCGSDAAPAHPSRVEVVVLHFQQQQPAVPTTKIICTQVLWAASVLDRHVV